MRRPQSSTSMRRVSSGPNASAVNIEFVDEEELVDGVGVGVGRRLEMVRAGMLRKRKNRSFPNLHSGEEFLKFCFSCFCSIASNK